MWPRLCVSLACTWPLFAFYIGSILPVAAIGIHGPYYFQSNSKGGLAGVAQ